MRAAAGAAGAGLRRPRARPVPRPVPKVAGTPEVAAAGALEVAAGAVGAEAPGSKPD